MAATAVLAGVAATHRAVGCRLAAVTRRLPAPLRAVAIDRPGYGASPLPPAGFAANARAVLGELDSCLNNGLAPRWHAVWQRRQCRC
jgi:pimeloyl-ACP methyl ester carboxylesterase